MSADAIVIGSGPNGLSAAIEIARNGHAVTVYEANDTIGGGCRSAELTLPGFVHDLCSAFHPLGAASPFFRELDLSREGLEWIEPPAALAHPLDDGTAVVLERSLDATACESRSRRAGRTADSLRPSCPEWTTSPLTRSDRSSAFRAILRHGEARSAGGSPGAPSRSDRIQRRASARALFAGIAAQIGVPLDSPLQRRSG